MTKLKVTIDGKEHIVDSRQVEACTEPTRGLFKPEMGEYYWCWSEMEGKPVNERYENDAYDRMDYLNSNCYPTGEACRRGQKRKEVLKRMEEIAAEGEPVSWESYGVKYYITFYHQGQQFEVHSSLHIQTVPGIYFHTRELAQKCIKELGRDLLMLLEG
jgi:hypothetical protein